MDATLLVKATLVLSVILLCALALRTAPPHARHRYWSVAFLAILSLPVLVRTMPAFQVPVAWKIGSPPPVLQPSEPVPSRPAAAPEISSIVSNVRPPPATSRSARPTSMPRLPVRVLLAGAWVLGTCLAVCSLLVSLHRVRRLTKHAMELDDPAWLAAVHDVANRLAFRRPVRLLVSDDVRTPMAGGLWRPSIFLPVACRRWTGDHRDVVLAHELAHLASRDPLRHVLARLAVAIYWFHPLAWMAARQADAAREEACDAAVLALGTRPSVYAQVLLDLAETMQRRPPLLAALPMVQRSLLEMRLMAILKDSRPVTRKLAAIPLFAIGIFTVALAAAQPSVLSPEVPGVPKVPEVPRVLSVPHGVPEVPLVPGVPEVHSVLEPAEPVERAEPVEPVAQAIRDCWRETFEGSFSGSASIENAGGVTRIYERIGISGDSRIIQKSFGDLRVCLIAENVGDRTWRTAPSAWLDSASRFLLETRRGNSVRRLTGEHQAPAGLRVSWMVDGRERPFDAAAQQWRDRLLAVLDTTWEMSALRGEESSLRGQISSIRGHESSLRGQISSLGGEVSSMNGRISSLRGEESSLRGRISSIRGHVSSLQGAISSERGAISSLNASRYALTDTDRKAIDASIAAHEAAIARIEQEIRAYDEQGKIAAVEREIAALDTANKIKAMEEEIRAFNLEGKIAEIERAIAGLDVRGKIQEIERQIGGLDVDRRVRELEQRRESQIKQLEAALAAIR